VQIPQVGLQVAVGLEFHQGLGDGLLEIIGIRAAGLDNLGADSHLQFSAPDLRFQLVKNTNRWCKPPLHNAVQSQIDAILPAFHWFWWRTPPSHVFFQYFAALRCG